MATDPISFALVNAFTTDSFGGNPAAVVFLKQELQTDLLLAIAKNLNQPIATFLYPSTEVVDGKTALFHVRWFTATREVPLCGHGSLAAAKEIFTRPGMVSKDVTAIQFRTASGVVVTIRKLEEGWLELELPAATMEEVSPDERQRLHGVVARALGREDVVINTIASGGKGFEFYLLVELDASVDLGGSNIDTSILAETSPYIVNVFTTASPKPEEIFVSRMFAPSAGVTEDHVCGSAHCLLGPHWSKKRMLGEQEMIAKQVSARGGDLKVVWVEDRGIIKLRGQAKAIAKGELLL